MHSRVIAVKYLVSSIIIGVFIPKVPYFTIRPTGKMDGAPGAGNGGLYPDRGVGTSYFVHLPFVLIIIVVIESYTLC